MKPWYKVILIVKSTEKILIHTTKQNLSKKYLKKIITTHLDAGGARLSRTKLIFADPAVQNPNIQPGVF